MRDGSHDKFCSAANTMKKIASMAFESEALLSLSFIIEAGYFRILGALFGLDCSCNRQASVQRQEPSNFQTVVWALLSFC